MEKSTGKQHQQIEIREERPLQTATPGIENQQVSLHEGKLSEQATRPDESFGQQETRHADPVQHLNGALPAMRPDSSDGGNTYDTLSSPADIHNFIYQGAEIMHYRLQGNILFLPPELHGMSLLRDISQCHRVLLPSGSLLRQSAERAWVRRLRRGPEPADLLPHGPSKEGPLLSPSQDRQQVPLLCHAWLRR